MTNSPVRCFFLGESYELFDLGHDLSETTDLVERMPEKVKELDAMLVAWLSDVGAKMPKPNPDYEIRGTGYR